MRVALAYAEKVGCVVTRKAGEALVTHPQIPTTVRVNVRKKDAQRALILFLREAEQVMFGRATPELRQEVIQKETKAMGHPVSEKHRELKLRLKNEVLRKQGQLGLTDADLSDLLSVDVVTVRAWTMHPTRMPGASVDRLQGWIKRLEEMKAKQEEEPKAESDGPVDLPKPLVRCLSKNGAFTFEYQPEAVTIELALSSLSDEALTNLLTSCTSEILSRKNDL